MNSSASTQQFIDIAGIKEGIVILNNGSYRLILSTSAINFSLKSEQEQNSLIFQYQGFLNSLHFPIEIVIQSKKLDLNQYLKKITDIKNKQSNELLAIQTEDYIDFVGQLIDMANIMKKSFFVVIGFDPIAIKSSVFDKLFSKKDQPAQLRVSDTEFKRYKSQLLERANIVASGLGAMGLHCVQLTTEEIIELFYKIYNPEVADKERFTDVNTLTSSIVGQKTGKESDQEQEAEQTAEERAIDNSMIVEEKQKQEAQIRQREDEKASAQQINATTPKVAPVNEKVAPVSQGAPQAPSTSNANQVQPANNPPTAPVQTANTPPAPTQGTGQPSQPPVTQPTQPPQSNPPNE